mgnify:CR=1 FL=1
MDRECGGCTACCFAFDVKELGKPSGTICQNARPGMGCGIYETRCETCHMFRCVWLNGFGRHMERPDRVGYLLHGNPEGNALVARAAYPGAMERRETKESLEQLGRKHRLFVVQ